MFLHDGGVLHRHIPAAKIDHARAVARVPIVQNRTQAHEQTPRRKKNLSGWHALRYSEGRGQPHALSPRPSEYLTRATLPKAYHPTVLFNGHFAKLHWSAAAI